LFFAGYRVVGGVVEHAAVVDLFLEGNTERAFPDLVDELDVALTHRGVDRLAVGLHVLDVIASVFENAADDFGTDKLA